MPAFTGKTTAPAASTSVDVAGAPVDTCLAIAWSATQPDRVGRAFRIRFGERRYVGRGDDRPEDFAHALAERPGETAAVDPHEEILAGNSISKRQLELHCVGHELDMKVVGRCPTYVNGVQVDAATIRPGDTVMLKGELLLLCILRPRTLSRPPGLLGLHPFGELCPARMAGESAPAWELRTRIAQVAASILHVLIQGPSGSGKELVAEAIHEQSPRAARELVATNSSDISPALVASELFGNMKNYPNHGMEARPGLVGRADGGTLFLDEVGDLAREAQVQLLRVMDSGQCRPVGESTSRRVDLRVIGATNRDDSAFREDFLARFKLRVRVPPLSERREDIPLIVRHLLLGFVHEDSSVERFIETKPGGRLEPRISVHFMDHLVRSPLPTNVRELELILWRSIHESHGDKLRLPGSRPPPSLLPRPNVPTSAPSPRRPGQRTKEELAAALAQYAGNIKDAARSLHMSRTTLYKLLEKHGLLPDPGQ